MTSSNKKYRRSSKKPCKKGHVRSRKTKRCRKSRKTSTKRKPCKRNQVRSRKTKRCRKSHRRKSSVTSRRKSTFRMKRNRESEVKVDRRKKHKSYDNNVRALIFHGSIPIGEGIKHFFKLPRNIRLVTFEVPGTNLPVATGSLMYNWFTSNIDTQNPNRLVESINNKVIRITDNDRYPNLKQHPNFYGRVYEPGMFVPNSRVTYDPEVRMGFYKVASSQISSRENRTSPSDYLKIVEAADGRMLPEFPADAYDDDLNGLFNQQQRSYLEDVIREVSRRKVNQGDTLTIFGIYCRGFSFPKVNQAIQYSSQLQQNIQNAGNAYNNLLSTTQSTLSERKVDPTRFNMQSQEVSTLINGVTANQQKVINSLLEVVKDFSLLAPMFFYENFQGQENINIYFDTTDDLANYPNVYKPGVNLFMKTYFPQNDPRTDVYKRLVFELFGFFAYRNTEHGFYPSPNIDMLMR